MKKPSEQYQELVARISELKTTDNYIRATSADKTKQLNTSIALLLAYNCAPIPSDSDIVIGQYYVEHIKGTWSQHLSNINEDVEVIDFDAIQMMAQRFYFARYNTAHGRKPLPVIIASVMGDTSLSGADRECLQALANAHQ